jgi:3-hydroxyacyl-CoA dehydrogenase/enoyl-CoA hydratase/3-hydroxybutyryl-CoA epimerase
MTEHTSPGPENAAKVGILGDGPIAAGIAAVSAVRTTATIRVKETDDTGVQRLLARVSNELSRLIELGEMTETEAGRVADRVTVTTDWTGFDDADLIIESGYESLERKRTLLAEAEAATGESTVFASNTSFLPISEIAADAARPASVLGMHYFSPAELMPLLEVVVTEKTSDRATATAVDFGRRQGKMVIVVTDGPGFYTTRLLVPYLNEAFFLLSEGATVEEIDGAMVRWGFPAGPFLLVDELGLGFVTHIMQTVVDAFGDRIVGPPDLLDRLIDDDRMGRANGRGFYRYDESGRRTAFDESIYDALGLGPRTVLDESMMHSRTALSMINEAARCLEEGVLRSALDGDVGAVAGLGFPPSKGGPFWWTDQVSARGIVERLEIYAAMYGERFEPAEILREYAASDRKFR